MSDETNKLIDKILLNSLYKFPQNYPLPVVESESPKIIVVGDVGGGNVKALQNTLQHGIFLFHNKDFAAEVTQEGKIILKEMMSKLDFNDLIIKKDTDGL